MWAQCMQFYDWKRTKNLFNPIISIPNIYLNYIQISVGDRLITAGSIMCRIIKQKRSTNEKTIVQLRRFDFRLMKSHSVLYPFQTKRRLRVFKVFCTLLLGNLFRRNIQRDWSYCVVLITSINVTFYSIMFIFVYCIFDFFVIIIIRIFFKIYTNCFFIWFEYTVFNNTNSVKPFLEHLQNQRFSNEPRASRFKWQIK